METMSTGAGQETPKASPDIGLFSYLPVNLFGCVMGLTGLSIAWRLAHERYGLPDVISVALAVIAVLTFLIVGAAYLAKCLTSSKSAHAELTHPITGNLFALILICFLLLPIVISPASLVAARIMWTIGAFGMTAFAWLVVDRWMTHRQELPHASPPWIVPVVGMLDVPLAVPALGLESLRGVMLLALGVGLFFAVPLFTLIFSRLIFQPPMPNSLQPTLLILLAPFAVGTSTYLTVVGHVDLFAESIYALTIFMLAVLLGRLRYMLGCCPFKVSWWAVSFPLAASDIAAFRIAAEDPGTVTDVLAVALLALASLVIAFLAVRTLWGIAQGELRNLSV